MLQAFLERFEGGVSDRVRFEVAGAAESGGDGSTARAVDALGLGPRNATGFGVAVADGAYRAPR